MYLYIYIYIHIQIWSTLPTPRELVYPCVYIYVLVYALIAWRWFLLSMRLQYLYKAQQAVTVRFHSFWSLPKELLRRADKSSEVVGYQAHGFDRECAVGRKSIAQVPHGLGGLGIPLPCFSKGGGARAWATVVGFP